MHFTVLDTIWFHKEFPSYNPGPDLDESPTVSRFIILISKFSAWELGNRDLLPKEHLNSDALFRLDSRLRADCKTCAKPRCNAFAAFPGTSTLAQTRHSYRILTSPWWLFGHFLPKIYKRQCPDTVLAKKIERSLNALPGRSGWCVRRHSHRLNLSLK